MDKIVHFKSETPQGDISLLCRKTRLPDQEALITTTIELCNCLPCLEVLWQAVNTYEPHRSLDT